MKLLVKRVNALRHVGASFDVGPRTKSLVKCEVILNKGGSGANPHLDGTHCFVVPAEDSMRWTSHECILY